MPTIAVCEMSGTSTVTRIDDLQRFMHGSGPFSKALLGSFWDRNVENGFRVSLGEIKNCCCCGPIRGE